MQEIPRYSKNESGVEGKDLTTLSISVNLLSSIMSVLGTSLYTKILLTTGHQLEVLVTVIIFTFEYLFRIVSSILKCELSNNAIFLRL